jgi:L-threonylcarbamoyladenylate synthase
MVLLGNDCSVGVESTVLDLCVYPFEILRPGGVSLESLQMYSDVVFKDHEEEPHGKPKSPGMKYAHYKPNAVVIAIQLDLFETISYLNIQKMTNRTAVFLFDEVYDELDHPYKVSLGSIKKPEEACKRLFAALRQCDEDEIDIIYCMCSTKDGLGLAFNNRLLRASSEVITSISE